MEKIKIVIDSTSDMTFEEIKKYDVEVVPLIINIDGIDYNYKSISNDEYIVKMRTAVNFSTSQPSIGNFLNVFEKWTQQGYKIIVLTVSSALSGTYNTAVSAASEFEGVYVVDTKTASRGMFYLLEETYNQIQQGTPIEKIVEIIEQHRKNLLTFVTIDNFDNLVKGGRLRKSAALIGGLLNIKILTQLKFDELVAVDKVRGKKKLVQALMKKIKEEKADRKIVKLALPNSLSDEYVNLIRNAIREEYGMEVNNSEIMTTTPVVSTHTGENAVGVIVELS